MLLLASEAAGTAVTVSVIAASDRPTTPAALLRRATLAVVAVLEISPPSTPATTAPLEPPRNLPVR